METYNENTVGRLFDPAANTKATNISFNSVFDNGQSMFNDIFLVHIHRNIQM